MFDLKSYDLFGISAKWRMFRQDTFNTKLSGFFTIIFYLYLIIKMSYLVYKFFSRTEFEVYYNESNLREDEPINIKNFEIAFCLYDKIKENFLPIDEYIKIESEYKYYDEYNNKYSDNSTLKIEKCTLIPENSIYFRTNFLSKEQISYFDKCFCSYPDSKKFEYLENFNLMQDSLHILQNSLNFSLKSINLNMNLSNLQLKLKIKDYYLGNSKIPTIDNRFQIINDQILIERVNSFKIDIEKYFLKTMSFFINESNYNQIVNMEIFNKIISTNCKYSLAEKVEENFVVKYYDKLNEEQKKELIQFKIFSNNKRIFYTLKFFGLDQIFSIFGGNLIFYFLVLNYFLKKYNTVCWNSFLEEIIEKRFLSHKSENKKLKAFFNMNYFSNLEKDDKNQNFIRSTEPTNENDSDQMNTYKGLFQEKKEKFHNLESSGQGYTDDLEFTRSANIYNINNSISKKSPNKFIKKYDIDLIDKNIRKKNKDGRIGIDVNKSPIKPNYNIRHDTNEEFFNNLISDNFSNEINNSKEQNTSKKRNNLDSKLNNYKQTKIDKNDDYVKSYIGNNSKTDDVHKKYSTLGPKIYNLKEVELTERFDVKKNIQDVFSIPKSRNQLLKDFIFNRVLDIDTYSNFIIEFYKLQKILLSNDLLMLFKKISNSSIFDEKNFSYYDFSINNYVYRDSKISINYDTSDYFNNYIFESLKKEFNNSKN